MSNLNWKYLLVSSLIIAAGASGAYYLFKHAGHAEEDSSSAPSNSSDLAATKKSKKRKSKKRLTGSASESTSKDSITTEIEAEVTVTVEKSLSDLASLCEQDSEVLLSLGVEDKQKVFYALLLKGEAVMNQGEHASGQAVKYFAKALAIVPNPGEILAAFEKSLPKEVFGQLLASLQDEVIKKTEKYFEMLAAASNGQIRFEAVTELDLLGKVQKRFAPIAARDIKKGGVLFEEVPDVVTITDLSLPEGSFCDHCTAKLPEDVEVFKCEKHEDAVYCSEICRTKGFELYHMYVCKARKEASDALEHLRRYCKEEAKSGLGLLMLRYVAMLLTEELKGNSAALSGPFLHYDNLPQLFPEAGEAEKWEAELIRSIFSTSNDNLADFLSDRIYASMKATLHRACFSFSAYNPLAINETDKVEAFRKVIGDNQDCDATGLYHLAAHLPHSCQPNVELGTNGSKIKAIAINDIPAGEPLNISFIPVDHIEDVAMRKERLFLNFMIDCQCTACQN